MNELSHFMSDRLSMLSLSFIRLKTCNLSELGTNNPSLSLSLMIICSRKTKTNILCATYSPKQ